MRRSRPPRRATSSSANARRRRPWPRPREARSTAIQYRSYVPRDEVWIDDDIHDDEFGFVLFHELHERNLMGKGVDYDTAHEEASRLERHYREHPAELHEALAAEGWE